MSEKRDFDPEGLAIEDLIEKFLREQRGKAPPSIDEFAQRYPTLRSELQRLLPAMDLLHQAADEIEHSRASKIPPAGAEMIGQKLAHYTVLDRLGAGGMGEVYLARDEHLGREVALKILPPEFSADEKRVARFHREAKLASALSHTNIATVYEAGQENGRHFISMELVRGETLTSRVKPGGLGLDRILDIAIPLAEGLAEAHRAGVVHRDLKPGNVMLDERGRVKILDFGLARPLPESDLVTAGLTSSGTVMGTPHYMAPEQMRGEETDARSDLFSLGVMLYELATGVRPFEGDSLAMVMNAVLQSEPPAIMRVNPHVGELFAHAVTRLLQKDANQRFQSASGLAAELRSLRNSTTTTLVPSRRSRVPLLLGGIAFVALATGLFYALWPDAPVPVVPASGEPIIAIVPFDFPEGDEEARDMALSLTYGLFEMLEPSVDLLATAWLEGQAKHRGIEAGALDAVTASEIARESGAEVIIMTTIERRRGELDLYMQLLDTSSGKHRASLHMPVAQARLLEHVFELAREVSGDLGLDLPDVGGTASELSNIPEALAMWAKGREAFDRGKSNEAVPFFEAAIDLDSEFAQAHFYRGWALWNRDGATVYSTSEGEATAKAVLDEAASFPGRLSEIDAEKLELLRKALEAIHGDSHELGYMDRARALAEANPRDKDAALLWVLYAAYHVGGSWAETIKACQSLLRLDPDHLQALYTLWYAAHATADEPMARDVTERILRSAPRSRAAMYALLDREEDEKAHDLIRELGFSPKTFYDRFWACRAALRLEDFDLVINIASQGWNRENYFEDQRRTALACLGRFDEARQDFLFGAPVLPEVRVELGFPIDGPFDPTTCAYRAGQLARISPDLGLQEIEQHIPESALADPRVRRLALWARGEIAYKQERYQEALDLFLQSVSRKGESENLRVFRSEAFRIQRAGRALREAERFDEAEEMLSRLHGGTEGAIFASNYPIPVIRSRWDLALCRDALEDPDGALVHLERFLEHWHVPDELAAPEIEHALEMYAVLTGAAYEPMPK